MAGTEKGVIYTQQTSAGRQGIPPSDLLGRVRCARIKLTAEGTPDFFQLVKLPAGKIRILNTSQFKVTAATGATTVSVGYAAYTNLDGSTTAASAAALRAATAASAGLGTFAAVPPDGLEITSQDGLLITATPSAALAANDVIEGMVFYVAD